MASSDAGAHAAIAIAREDPRQPEVVALIDALDRYQSALYPAESNHFLDLDALAASDIRFFVARAGGLAIGCGALRVVPPHYGELKRMYVAPERRGRGIGRRLLVTLEAAARAERLPRLALETGIAQPEALGLYTAAGFVDGPPFGEYRPDPLSRFLFKHLTGASELL
jgi:putative acetyltransferase